MDRNQSDKQINDLVTVNSWTLKLGMMILANVEALSNGCDRVYSWELIEIEAEKIRKKIQAEFQ